MENEEKGIPFIEKVSKIINNHRLRKCIMQVECSKILLDSFIVFNIPFKKVNRSMITIVAQMQVMLKIINSAWILYFI